MDYNSAFEIFDKILTRLKSFPDKFHLMTAIGFSLQLGDLKRAASSFKAVEALIIDMKKSQSSETCSSEVTKFDHQVLMNKGLLLLCQNRYKDAVLQFQQIVNDNPYDVVGEYTPEAHFSGVFCDR